MQPFFSNDVNDLLGLPLPDLEVLNNASNPHVSAKPQNTAPITDPKSLIGKQCHPKPANHHGPNSIVFLRRRILYGRIESKREIPCGLGQTRMSPV